MGDAIGRNNTPPTFERVCAEFQRRGLTLNESEYQNNCTRMRYKCGHGHQGRISWASLRKGCGCKRCADIERGKRQKLTFEYVASEFSKRGFILLDLCYVNAQTKMKYVCNGEHVAFITWGNFQQGRGCKRCASIGESNGFWRADREQYRLERKCRKACYRMLNRMYLEGDKTSTQDILGYSHLDLKEHIELHPNWDRVKNRKWAIDHIFPIQAFFKNNIYDVKLINCLSNLQPLLRIENSSKGDKYCEKEFDAFLKKMRK